MANVFTVGVRFRLEAHAQKVRISIMKSILVLKSAFIAVVRQVLAGHVVKVRAEDMCLVDKINLFKYI